jgi:hypothetical protein
MQDAHCFGISSLLMSVKPVTLAPRCESFGDGVYLGLRRGADLDTGHEAGAALANANLGMAPSWFRSSTLLQ